ncbi:hypothetical protein Adt_31240 [Abeliophyllum distichum]|uniref:Uncharacterized protein n=1 Tax=Abeliophyllum distichum TaxID=126358 RepID=A0ABD1RDH6_9LAMI
MQPTTKENNHCKNCINFGRVSPNVGGTKQGKRTSSRSVSVFDRLGDKAVSHQRKSRVFEGQKVESVPRNAPYILDYYYDDEENGPTTSCELDDEDEDLNFSKKIWSIFVSQGFVRPKLEKYTGRGDPIYRIADYKSEMKLKTCHPH